MKDIRDAVLILAFCFAGGYALVQLGTVVEEYWKREVRKEASYSGRGGPGWTWQSSADGKIWKDLPDQGAGSWTLGRPAMGEALNLKDGSAFDSSEAKHHPRMIQICEPPTKEPGFLSCISLLPDRAWKAFQREVGQQESR
jgi:hypothetical protein